MRKHVPSLVVGSLSVVVSGTAVIADDTAPRWDVAEICTTSPLGANCATVESRHRRAVFNRWQTVPVAERTECEMAVVSSGQRSYRALLTCLEGQQLRAIEQIPKSSAVQTGPVRGSAT